MCVCEKLTYLSAELIMTGVSKEVFGRLKQVVMVVQTLLAAFVDELKQTTQKC